MKSCRWCGCVRPERPRRERSGGNGHAWRNEEKVRKSFPYQFVPEGAAGTIAADVEEVAVGLAVYVEVGAAVAGGVEGEDGEGAFAGEGEGGFNRLDARGFGTPVVADSVAGFVPLHVGVLATRDGGHQEARGGGDV